MEFETIRYGCSDGVATITLNRPDRLNAWTPTMGREMTDAFRTADRDRSVRAIILTGAGRAFCAGPTWTSSRRRFAQEVERDPTAATGPGGSRSSRP